MGRSGVIYLLIGPAGAGKNTLLAAWREAAPKLGRIISTTTRLPRGGEVRGREYVFTTRERFLADVKKVKFAEWAEIHKHLDGTPGDLYGKPRKPLVAAIKAGRDLATDIDIQGARSLKKAFLKNVVTVFVLPPSAAEIKRRLLGRGTESAARIRDRLHTAVAEIAAMGEFDYLVINDDVKAAVGRLEAIRQAESTRMGRHEIAKMQRRFRLKG